MILILEEKEWKMNYTDAMNKADVVLRRVEGNIFKIIKHKKKFKEEKRYITGLTKEFTIGEFL